MGVFIKKSFFVLYKFCLSGSNNLYNFERKKETK